MRGYCYLVLKRHAVELHDLGADEGAALMEDIRRAAAAPRAIAGAVELNYEIHGNTIPPLHVHLFPRYKRDPFEDGPIDPRRSREWPYNEGEVGRLRRLLQAELGAG